MEAGNTQPTFYHDFGAGGTVFNINNMPTIKSNTSVETINENFPIPYLEGNFGYVDSRGYQIENFYLSITTNARCYFTPGNRLTIMVPTEIFYFNLFTDTVNANKPYRKSIPYYAKSGFCSPDMSRLRIGNLPITTASARTCSNLVIDTPTWDAYQLPFQPYNVNDIYYRNDQWTLNESLIALRRWPGLQRFSISPTISQYPRSGKVQLGSDHNIYFGGDGWTYTMDFGPYVGLNNTQYGNIPWSRSYIVGSESPYSNLVFARAGDPIDFKITSPPEETVIFEIRKINDARGWAGWYLWTNRKLKQGDTLEFFSPACAPRANNDPTSPVYVYYTETRFGKTTGGVEYAPITDTSGATWTLQKT
jgi:hypothetical protein